MPVWGCEVTSSASPLVPRSSCASVAISAQASPILVDQMYTYPNIYCTPPIPIHKKRNKKFAAHRQHNATSVRHITQLFPLGRLGVRSHNFCEVTTSATGVSSLTCLTRLIVVTATVTVSLPVLGYGPLKLLFSSWLQLQLHQPGPPRQKCHTSLRTQAKTKCQHG